MAGFAYAKAGKKTSGGLIFQFSPEKALHLLIGDDRGAYCATVLIVLLDLPLELPAEADARKYGHDTLLSGLADYLSRCERRPIPDILGRVLVLIGPTNGLWKSARPDL
jgi:hypothetical protein